MKIEMTSKETNDGCQRLTDRCSLCRKEKGRHQSGTLHCPVGPKTRVGYVQFSVTDKYTPVSQTRITTKNKKRGMA